MAFFWMSVAMAFWTAMETMGSLIPPRYSPYQTVWTRYGTHLLFMLLVLGPKQKVRFVKTQRLGLQILRSLLMIGMPFCFIMAVSRMRPDLVWAIFWVSPMLALVLAALLLGNILER